MRPWDLLKIQAMHIVGIDHEHTKDTFNVAFVVDNPPDLEVLAKVKAKDVNIDYRDGLLYVSTDPDNFIEMNHVLVKEINDLYSKSEREINSERRRKTALHEQDVCMVSDLMKLPIREKNGLYRV